MFLAVTKETASWLLTKPELVTALGDVLNSEQTVKALRGADMVEGAVRLSGTPDGRIIACWNSDYLSGTGDENWGFIKVDSPLGLLDEPDAMMKVIQTELQAVNLRLNGLRFDYTFIHRHDNGIHTIRADRGELGRRLNLAYVEGSVALESGEVNSIMLVGPAHDLDVLKSRAEAEAPQLAKFVRIANSIITPTLRRPILDSTISRQIRLALDLSIEATQGEPYQDAEVSTPTQVERTAAFTTASWKYEDWFKHPEQLSAEQRFLLQEDPLREHPVRIVGPAGSGKSLIMQLIAAKRLREAVTFGAKPRILYIVHNSAMELNVRERFSVLEIPTAELDDDHGLIVSTLSRYATNYLRLDSQSIIDVDAYETKRFQVTQVIDALGEAFKLHPEMGAPPEDSDETDLFRQMFSDDSLLPLFARLIVAEISTAIKGHGLIEDRPRYVYATRSLSRLHGIMGTRDRDFVFSVFEIYHRDVFHRANQLDPDDVAISLLGQLDTPIWQLRRKKEGFDFIFVDETQLFNENERRLFPLLAKGTTPLAPIALALDEAQELFGQTSAGFAALGIEGIKEERLPSNHRSTEAIVRLAFFVIEKTTDLFGPSFPEFGVVRTTIPADHELAATPKVIRVNSESPNIGRFVAKRVSDLRREGIKRIAVICHSDAYWEILKTELEKRLTSENEKFYLLLQRGEMLAPTGPLRVLTRPAYVGGQEFEAVISVGLEQGLVPPRVTNNPALENAVFQQALREMYLAISRAQFRYFVAIDKGATPSKVIQEAVDAGRLEGP